MSEQSVDLRQVIAQAIDEDRDPDQPEDRLFDWSFWLPESDSVLAAIREAGYVIVRRDDAETASGMLRRLVANGERMGEPAVFDPERQTADRIEEALK